MTPEQRTDLLNEVVASLAIPAEATRILPSHLDRYDWLRSQLPATNVAVHTEFQRKFSGLFRLRFMPTGHRAAYFQMMETEKGADALEFPTLLSRHHVATGRWEVSFVSKLIHIIHPTRAVWDTLVSGRLGLALPPARNAANCSAAYLGLETEMATLLAHPLFPAIQTAFAARFPGRDYTPMRILDVSIWGLG